MTKEELELKISGLEKAIATCQDETSGYEDSLKTTQQQLKDLGKIALPPVVFDDIYEAVEKAVEKYDFSDTDNFDIEYGIEYDGKVHCESHEFCNSDDLVQMILEKVSRVFTEELDTTEDDNHKPVE